MCCPGHQDAGDREGRPHRPGRADQKAGTEGERSRRAGETPGDTEDRRDRVSSEGRGEGSGPSASHSGHVG